MKKALMILSAFILSITLFFKTNLTNPKKESLDLASLISMNIANAEDTYPCYDNYASGGNWYIIKCSTCTEVRASAWSGKSTCN